MFCLSIECNTTVYTRVSDNKRVMIKTYQINGNKSESRNVRIENSYYDYIQMT